jgi:hypothetical protein
MLDVATARAATDLVRRHHIHYDVRDELIVDGEKRIKIGYRVRLWAVVSGPHLLPGETGESPFTAVLRALAEKVIPSDHDGASVLLEAPAAALYESRVIAGADEVAFDIRIQHGALGTDPAGNVEERCLTSIRKTLESLGARQLD